MWYTRTKGRAVNRHYLGLSLTEILISLFLGVFLLLLSSQLYVDLYRGASAQHELFKLQQNTRQLLNYMKQNMEYIGYQGNHREGSNYDLFLFENKAYYLANPQCFIFFYDVNNDGCVGVKEYRNCRRNDRNMLTTVANEFFGFQLRNHKLYLLNRVQRTCNQGNCNKWTESCHNTSDWKEITQLIDYKIKHIHFEWKKIDQLMAIQLTLESEKEENLTYTESAYVYILNSGD